MRNTSIVLDEKNNSIAFAASEIKNALEFIGHTVNLVDLGEILNVNTQNMIILTTRGTKEANSFLKQEGIAPLPTSQGQGYSIRKKISEKSTQWYVIGFDEEGTLIGGLDFGLSIKLQGMDEVNECDKIPYIKQRGIKFNIPLDARTPSYSDSGDSAQANISNVWEMDFWCEFLDEMARNHFNVLSLWNLNPFPSMVKVSSYPKVALADVMKTNTPLAAGGEGRKMSTPTCLKNLKTLKVITIDEKIKFWQQVMEYAKNRKIDIYIFTWNTFVYGTENSGYGFTDAVTDAVTQDYFRKSVEALINTYPLLKGIGITAGENMSRNAEVDEAWLYNTYGQGINDALASDEKRTFRLIHRIQYANISKAFNAFSLLNNRCTIDTSFKYSQAHMYSSIKPHYINSNKGAYMEDIGDHKSWLTLRDDDYYMFRGGSDSEFVRAYIKNIPNEKLQGFYIGSDGYTWGREYISKDSENLGQQIIKKRWYSFLLWGGLAYDPDFPQRDLIKILRQRFPEVKAQNLYESWSKASQLIPLVNRFHNENCEYDFQWYPEACTSEQGFHNINSFINNAPQSGEGIMSIPDYTYAILNKTTLNGTTPIEISQSLEELSDQVIELTKDMLIISDKELHSTLEDINALAILGKYYSKKILGAVNKCLADKAGTSDSKLVYKNIAIEALMEASHYWRCYAAKVESLYVPQALTRLIPELDKHRYTDVSRLQADVDMDIKLV